MPAVLSRPHPLTIELARPPYRRQMPGVIGLDLPTAADSARALVDRCKRVRPLVRLRSDPDHVHRPFVRYPNYGRTVGGQLSPGAKPRSYQVTPAIIRQRRAT